MPLRSPSSPLNLASSALHVLRAGRAWLEESHPALPSLDLPSVAFLALMLQGSLTIMLRQAARVGVVGGGVQAQQHRDSPLLTLAQQHQLALGLIYLHCFQREAMDAVISTPLGLTALAAVILTLALLPSAAATRVSAFWRRFFFLWPPLATVLWALLGYALPRYALPATSGSGLAGWSIDPMGFAGGGAEAAREAAREERAGAELCAYSWTASGARNNSMLSSTAALRVCMDLSLLCLIFSGLIYPLVECAREMSAKCTQLHATKDNDTATPAKAIAAPSAVPSAAAPSAPSVKQRKKQARAAVAAAASTAAASPKFASDSDSDTDDSSAVAESGSSAAASLFAWSHMAALCMSATWVVSLLSLALAHEYAEVLPAATSACPSMGSSGGAMGAFEREAALLRDASCRLQWSRLSYAHTLLYASVGLLATLFSLWSNPLPVVFRTPTLTMLAMSLWKGTIIAPCVVIATECTAEMGSFA